MINDDIKFNSQVAYETNTIMAAVAYEELQWFADENGVAEVRYNEMFEYLPDEVEACLNRTRQSLVRLEKCGFGKFTKGNRGKRPTFKFSSEVLEPDCHIRYEYFVTKGTKEMFIYDLLGRISSDLTRDERQESKLILRLFQECNGIVSEDGIRVALIKLQKKGLVHFVREGRNAHKRYRKGFKFLSSVKGIEK